MSKQTIGERLRGARESIPASLYQASRETRIRVDFLECMEKDDFKFLSGSAYVKGLLRSYGRWLDLDDESLAKEFDETWGKQEVPPLENLIREPAQPAPKSRKPAWLVAATVTATILLGLSLVGLLDVSRVAPPPSPQEQVADGSSVAPQQEAAAPPVVQSVQVVLATVDESSWMSVTIDGSPEPAFEGNLKPGSVKTFDAKERIFVVVGNSGAVRITYNGRDLGILGTSGKSQRHTFTPTSHNFG